jgi:hypothetical protein
MVKYMLLETVSFTKLFENMRQIAAICANSKRKRLPALIGCLSLSKRIWVLDIHRIKERK